MSSKELQELRAKAKELICAKRIKHIELWKPMHAWCAKYRKDHHLTVRQFIRGIGLNDRYNLCQYLGPSYANGNWVPLSRKEFTAYGLYRRLKELYRNQHLLDEITFDPPTLIDIAYELNYLS